MDNSLNKTYKNKNILGIISFIIGVIPISSLIILTTIDLFLTIALMPGLTFLNNTITIMNICFLVNIFGILLGCISLIKKPNKNKLAIWGVVINSFIPISLFISILKYIF